jgi:hypothetical protein
MIVTGPISVSPYVTTSAPTPPRARGSVRRTSTIEAQWPQGRQGPMRMIGRARDILTPADGGPSVVCAEDAFEAEVKDRAILSIRAEPDRPGLGRLVGLRGGGHLRSAIAESAPQDARDGTPLYLILDDISGASLVAGWAWTHWDAGWVAQRAELVKHHKFEDICIGFREGSPAIAEVRQKDNVGSPTVDLRHPEDPDGWHAFATPAGAGFRRARWIEVRLTDRIVIEAGFQDSANTPEGGRAAVHEYRITAAADPKTQRLLSIQPHPQILPYAECQSAVDTAARLVGAPLSELRHTVLTELRGPMGCTHLNDALRALAEAPVLAARLQGL